MKFASLLIVLLACSFAGAAEVADIFTDGAVLQQGEPVNVWGTADAGETVTVSFAGQAVETQADAEGQWLLKLQPLQVDAEGQTLTVAGSNSSESVVLSDVLVGEVWLAGGQSNMATAMNKYLKKTRPDIDAANDPLLRMITVPKVKFKGDKVSADFAWKRATPENVRDFSATAYYFAMDMRKQVDVPVGIVSCSYGGTPAEAWMSREVLSSKPDLKRILDAYDLHVATTFANEADYLAKKQAYDKAMRLHNQSKKKPRSERLPKPKMFMGPREHKRPCGLYENMLTRTIPYTVKGVIWYQGENNATTGNGYHYRSVFSTLIDHWRDEFGKPDLPFLFVQLASLGRGAEPLWAELRDAQKWVDENVPNTGMVVALDAGEKNDIHPHAKDVVGERLAGLALNRVYGKLDLVCEGPLLRSMQKQGATLVLTFESGGSGLALKDGGENTFEIAGADGKYIAANAKLVEGKVVVSSPEVAVPAHVRYGWHTWVIPTLFNAEGLPASPFRSDDYTAVTADSYYFDDLNVPVPAE